MTGQCAIQGPFSDIVPLYKELMALRLPCEKFVRRGKVQGSSSEALQMLQRFLQTPRRECQHTQLPESKFSQVKDESNQREWLN